MSSRRCELTRGEGGSSSPGRVRRSVPRDVTADCSPGESAFARSSAGSSGRYPVERRKGKGTMQEEQEDERLRRAQHLARAAVTESARAIRILSARADDAQMLDEALAALNLVRSLAQDDPLVESLAVQLLLSSKSAMTRSTSRSVRS